MTLKSRELMPGWHECICGRLAFRDGGHPCCTTIHRATVEAGGDCPACMASIGLWRRHWRRQRPDHPRRCVCEECGNWRVAHTVTHDSRCPCVGCETSRERGAQLYRPPPPRPTKASTTR